MVLPTLARRLGLNAAIVLQQLHFLTLRSPHVRHGSDRVLRRWEFRTLKEWHQAFPWWSQRTIERTFEALVADGLVLVEQFGKARGDMTNWYAVHHEAVERLADETDHVDKMAASTSRQNGEMAFRQLDVFSMTTDCRDAHVDNMTRSSIQEGFVVVEKEQEQQHRHPAARAREADPAASPDGVVVDGLDDQAEDEIPTPRVEAYRLLRRYGVTEHRILPLIRHHSDAEIERQVAHLDFERSQGKAIRNPGGRLAQMIREQWALPPGAEAVYRRRFRGEGVAGEVGVPALVVEASVEMEPDAFELEVAALPEEERASLRARAEERALEQDPELGGYQLEYQVQYQMRRLLPRSAHDPQDDVSVEAAADRGCLLEDRAC